MQGGSKYEKNIGILAGLFFLAAILAACGRSAEETGNFNTPGNGSSGSLETILALESETVEATETGEPETVLIYYGSSIGKELKTEEVDLPRKTPEAHHRRSAHQKYRVGGYQGK